MLRRASRLFLCEDLMKRNTKIILLLSLALCVLMLTTQPASIVSGILVIPFVLLFIVLFLLAKSLFAKIDKGRNGMAVLAALFPVVLLAMQSVGQLTIRDFLMILGIFAIVYFYMRRMVRFSAE